jgi:hypothetical protein
MLRRRTRMNREQLVAPRPVARTFWKFFRNPGCALALALPFHSFAIVLRCFDRSFPLPRPIPATLGLTPRFSPRTGSIPLGRTPPPPALCRLPTLPAAISGLGTARLKPALAALQQAPPRSPRPPAVLTTTLTGLRTAPRLKRVHGSCELPPIQPRGAVLSASRGAFSRPSVYTAPPRTNPPSNTRGLALLTPQSRPHTPPPLTSSFVRSFSDNPEP